MELILVRNVYWLAEVCVGVREKQTLQMKATGRLVWIETIIVSYKFA